MIKKFYAVKQGRKTGIFNTWEECKAQVDGFKGAQYKSFKDRSEAEAYCKDEEKSNLFDASETAVAYVDGSYKHETLEYACGAILFYKGEEVYFSEKYRDIGMREMRNVAGEIMGSMSVISYCLENNIKAIEIYYDYEGIAKWAKGEWKCNKDGTKAYKEFCQNAMSKMQISFVKVKGHSGDKYNDLADALAKKALGII